MTRIERAASNKWGIPEVLSDFLGLLSLFYILLVTPTYSAEKDFKLKEFKENLDNLTQRIKGLETKFEAFKKDYSPGAGVFTPSQLKKKFDEGVFAFLKEDHLNAALLFYMVLESEGLIGTREYLEAEWYLAESLYFCGNYLPALEYLSRIVDRGKKHPYYELALWRLIEILGIIGDREKFELYFRTYSGKGGIERLSDKMLYSLGKSLFFQKRYSDAFESFNKIPQGSNIYPMAKYFQGVTLISMGKIDEAIKEFERVLESSITSKEGKEIEELAIIALARVYFEKGDFEKAIDLYQEISRESPYFLEALYELSWCYIKREQYDKAFKTIDILIVTFPDSKYAPAMKLLASHLLQKIHKYDSALENYEKVIDEFTSVKKGLEDTLSTKEKIIEYFRRMVIEKALPLEQRIPPFIASIARADRNIDRSIELSRELDLHNKSLTECDKLLSQIEKVIKRKDSFAKIESFKRGRESIIKIRTGINFIKNQLFLIEADYLKNYLKEEDLKKLQKVEKIGSGIEEISGIVPEIQKDYEEREEVYQFQIEELHKNLIQLKTLIEDYQSQFSALNVFLNSPEAKKTLTDDEIKKKIEEIKKEKEILTGLYGDVEDVETELGKFEIEGVLRNFYIKETEKAISAIKDKISSEDYLLLSILDKYPSLKEDGQIRELELLKDRISRFEGRVEKFYTGLSDIEIQGINDLKKKVEREKEDINRFSNEFDMTRKEITRVLEVIGEQNFQAIKDFLDDLILKANVGILDTVWELKNNKTKALRDISSEQTERLKDLENNFKSLIKD